MRKYIALVLALVCVLGLCACNSNTSPNHGAAPEAYAFEAQYKKRLTQAEKRIGELDRLFIKIYEDNAKGNLSDERFAMMSKTYEDEQAQLKVEIVNLQKEVEVQERQIENLEQFIQRVRRYITLTELTPYALRELVKAVYVEAPDKSSGKRKQKVHIEYDLVGYIPVDELIKAEQA